MKSNSIQCNTIQCNVMQCDAIQYNALQCNAMQKIKLHINQVNIILVKGWRQYMSSGHTCLITLYKVYFIRILTFMQDLL